MEKHVGVMAEMVGLDAAPITAQMFGNAGKEHMEKYGTKAEHMAKIAYKNHKHSTNNPLVKHIIPALLCRQYRFCLVYELLTNHI